MKLTFSTEGRGTYPLIRCRDHQLAPGYAVCVHVVNGQSIVAKEEPDSENIGSALCAICADPDQTPELTVDMLRLVCAKCLQWRLPRGE